MKIKMIAGLSGPKVSLAPGQTKFFDDALEAQRLIDAGFAELAANDAVAPAPTNETNADRVSRLEAELKDARAALKAETTAAKAAAKPATVAQA